DTGGRGESGPIPDKPGSRIPDGAGHPRQRRSGPLLAKPLPTPRLNPRRIIDIMAERPRYLFVTGRLAEFALRQVLNRLSSEAGVVAEVVVLPITAAALMTPRWVARHLQVPPRIDKVFLPGYCGGDLDPVQEKAAGVPVERGPVDLADLPRHFGHAEGPPSDY